MALVGLSEGGLIAPMIATRDTTLEGIVLLAGPASRGRQVLEYQFRYAIEQSAEIRPERRDSVFRAQLAEAETLRREQPWLNFFWDYDPLATARRVRVSALVLQGSTDRNVPPGDAEKLAAAFRAGGNRDVTLRTFEGFNHVFVRDPDGNPRRYASLPSLVVPRRCWEPWRTGWWRGSGRDVGAHGATAYVLDSRTKRPHTPLM